MEQNYQTKAKSLCGVCMVEKENQRYRGETGGEYLVAHHLLSYRSLKKRLGQKVTDSLRQSC